MPQSKKKKEKKNCGSRVNVLNFYPNWVKVTQIWVQCLIKNLRKFLLAYPFGVRLKQMVYKVWVKEILKLNCMHTPAKHVCKTSLRQLIGTVQMSPFSWPKCQIGTVKVVFLLEQCESLLNLVKIQANSFTIVLYQNVINMIWQILHVTERSMGQVQLETLFQNRYFWHRLTAKLFNLKVFCF